jgi:hypothetical protein
MILSKAEKLDTSKPFTVEPHLQRVHQFGVLNEMTDEEFDSYMMNMRKHATDTPNHREIIRSNNKEELAHKALTEGAGFSAALHKLGNLSNPFLYARKMKTRRHNLKHHRSMKKNDFDMAALAKDVYRKPGDRGVAGWVLDGRYSDDRHAVYGRGNEKVFAIRGTKSVGDILPDLKIAIGIQDRSQSYQDSKALFERARSENRDVGKWSVTGHSLGGNKAMWVADQAKVESYAFNPGFVGSSNDQIDSGNKRHHVYHVQGDPVSSSILKEELNDLTLLPSVSANPLKNHAMDNFIFEP